MPSIHVVKAAAPGGDETFQTLPPRELIDINLPGEEEETPREVFCAWTLTQAMR